MCLNLLFKTYQVTLGILKALFFDFIIMSEPMVIMLCCSLHDREIKEESLINCGFQQVFSIKA